MKDFNNTWEKLDTLNKDTGTESLTEAGTVLGYDADTTAKIAYWIKHDPVMAKEFDYLSNYSFKHTIDWVGDIHRGTLLQGMSLEEFVSHVLSPSAREEKRLPEIDKDSYTGAKQAARYCINVLAILVIFDRLVDRLAENGVGSFTVPKEAVCVSLRNCSPEWLTLKDYNFCYQGVVGFRVDVDLMLLNFSYDHLSKYTLDNLNALLNNLYFRVSFKLSTIQRLEHTSVIKSDSLYYKYSNKGVNLGEVPFRQLPKVLKTALADMEKDLLGNRPTLWYIKLSDTLDFPGILSTEDKTDLTDIFKDANKEYKPDRRKRISKKAVVDLIVNPVLEGIANNQWKKDTVGNYYIESTVTDKDLAKYTKENNLLY